DSPGLAYCVGARRAGRATETGTRSGNELHPPRALGRLARIPGEPRTKELLCLVLVMCPTPQLDVLHRGCSALRVRPHMMKLQERGLGAAALCADEGTPSLIASPHGPADSRWNRA